MRFRQIQLLSAPNEWARSPVLEATLELGEFAERPSNTLPGFGARLLDRLPALKDHRCRGYRGGFADFLEQGTDQAHVIEHVTQELQTQAGVHVPLGWAGQTAEPGVYTIVVPFEDDQLARACLESARELCLATAAGREFDIRHELSKLRELADRICLGPSTRAMLKAAQARNIPVRRINDGRMLQLGYGARQRRINRAETSNTSAIAKALSEDKDFTNSLLKAVGVPVPEGRAVESAADAWEAAQECGLPVVVKPREGSQGRGVSIGLNSREAVEAAYPLAEEVGGGVLVERYVPGAEHRLLVVNGRVIAAARGDEARIKGDGTHTVAELVESQLNTDPRRGDAAACPLALIEFDSIVLITLNQQGLNPESIPSTGASVLVRRNGNLAVDVTDEVHPEVAARAVEAAAVVGLDVCGLDVVALDIGRPLEEQGGVIVDVNEGPGLQMHLQPAIGKPRPVAEAILATLIPPGESGRIPIIGVAGGSAAAIAAKVIARALGKAFGPVGRTSAEGVFVNNRLIHAGDARDPASAELLLMNPVIEAAVFEQAHSGRLVEGLGFDLCDVAVVTGLAKSVDDSSGNGIPRVDQARLARTLVETVSPSGTAVLDATDPLAAALALFCPGSVIFFAADGADPILAQHLVREGRGVFQRGDLWVLAEGELEVEYSYSALAPFIEFERGTFSVSAALAALAVAWSLGIHIAPRREGQENGAAGRRAVG